MLTNKSYSVWLYSKDYVDIFDECTLVVYTTKYTHRETFLTRKGGFIFIPLVSFAGIKYD